VTEVSLNVSSKNLVILIFIIYKGSILLVLTILFGTEVTTESFYKFCVLI